MSLDGARETKAALHEEMWRMQVALQEAKSAFSWLATEVENGRQPALPSYARLHEARIADVLDEVTYWS